MLSLAITLSAGERKPSDVFAVSGAVGADAPAASCLQLPLCAAVRSVCTLQAAPGPAPPTCNPHSPPPACTCVHAQLVFTEVALGAVVLTVNVILLGGDIVFFQSMCLIGYCLFPVNIAAIVCLFVKIRVSGGGVSAIITCYPSNAWQLLGAGCSQL